MKMAKIGLTDGFSVIPEGTYIFQITAVEYKEAFGKLQVHMRTQSGQKHTERFGLLKADGSPNEGALNAFSYFAKNALNDFSRTEIDEQELVGCFLECDVEHDVQPNKNKPGQTVTFARLTDKRPSDGWADASTPKAPAAPAQEASAAPTAPAGGFNLDDLLGGI